MNKYPKELLDIYSDKAVSNNKKINSNENVATVVDNNTGKGYFAPAFLIVPYEGCGGDCNKKLPDCVNSIEPSTLFKFVGDFNYFNGKDCSDVGNAKNLCLMANGDNGDWNINPIYSKSKVQQAMYNKPPTPGTNKANSYFAVTDLTDWGTQIPSIAVKQETKHVNYCSGVNMHFDIAENAPLWSQNIDNGGQYSFDKSVNLIGVNAVNTVVRYIKVPGNIFGEFDLEKPSGPTNCKDNTNYISCPGKGYYDSGTSKTCPGGAKPLKPNDPKWPGSKCAKHNCCKSV